MAAVKVLAADPDGVSLRGVYEARVTWPELRAAAYQVDDDLAVPYAVALLDALERFYRGPDVALKAGRDWLEWHRMRVRPYLGPELADAGYSRAFRAAERRRVEADIHAELVAVAPVTRRVMELATAARREAEAERWRS
jgi:hypothetical protein